MSGADAILAGYSALQDDPRGSSAECLATGSPREPEFETVCSFPRTDNDPASTGKVAAAFRQQFGASAGELERQTVSEDLSKIPAAALAWLDHP